MSAGVSISAPAQCLIEGRRIPARACDHAPSSPGVYAWWLEEPAARHDLGLADGAELRPLYVGVAACLPRRLRRHLGPTDRGGYLSFRWRLQGLLAANGVVAPSAYRLLSGHMDLPTGIHRRLPLWEAAEKGCTEWMLDNLHVTVLEGTSLAVARAVEGELIAELLPLLNQTKACRAAAANSFSPSGQRNARTFFGGGGVGVMEAVTLVRTYWPTYPRLG